MNCLLDFMMQIIVHATERVVNRKKLVVNVESVADSKKLVVNVERVVHTKKLGVSVVNLSCLTIYDT